MFRKIEVEGVSKRSGGRAGQCHVLASLPASARPPPSLNPCVFTCWNWPSAGATTTSHRSPTLTLARGRGSPSRPGGRYSLTYSPNERTGTRASLKYTATPRRPSTPAKSYVRLRNRARASSSRPSMPKRAKSGANDTRVQLSLDEQADTSAGPTTDMLAPNSWRYARLRDPSAVSTRNFVENTLASLAPYPLRPPVTFFCASS